MGRGKGKNSWKVALIKSIERLQKLESLIYEFNDEVFNDVSNSGCYLCKKADENGGIHACSSCILSTVLSRLRTGQVGGIGCLHLSYFYAKEVGYERILEAVKRTPREKLTPSYFRRIGIPKELHGIMDELRRRHNVNNSSSKKL